MKTQIALLNQNVSLNKILQLAFPTDEFELLVFRNPLLLEAALPDLSPSAFLIGLSCLGEGSDIACRLRAREETGHIPLFAIEEAFRGKDEPLLHESLFSGFFRFPFDAGALVKEVSRYIEAVRPSLPLPEDPLFEESEVSGGGDHTGLDERIGRLAEDLWERRRERLKTEIITEVREDLRTVFGDKREPEDS